MSSFELSSKYIESSPSSGLNTDFTSPPPNSEQPTRLTPFSRYPFPKNTPGSIFWSKRLKIRNNQKKKLSCYTAFSLRHVSCMSRNPISFQKRKKNHFLYTNHAKEGGGSIVGRNFKKSKFGFESPK